MTPRRLIGGCILLLIVGIALVIGIFLAPLVHISIGQTGATGSGGGNTTTGTDNNTTNPSSSNSTPVPTQQPQSPVTSNASGAKICSDTSCPPYKTQDGATVICAGDVSVVEPNGNQHNPDGVGTDGEEVAISAGGYTIIFTNSADCKQYPKLSSSQIQNILANIAAGQRASGCNGGCTGTEQTWIFP